MITSTQLCNFPRIYVILYHAHKPIKKVLLNVRIIYVLYSKNMRSRVNTLNDKQHTHINVNVTVIWMGKWKAIERPGSIFRIT